MATESSTDPAAPLSREEIAAFAADWYRKLDHHADLTELFPMLVDEGLSFQVPEGLLTTREDFRAWYVGGTVGDNDLPGVVNVFFDEVHTVRRVDVSGPPERPVVDVLVNWQARIWQKPAARSQWIGFDAVQRWEMLRDAVSGQPVIARYVVDELRPMPGSPPL